MALSNKCNKKNITLWKRKGENKMNNTNKKTINNDGGKSSISSSISDQ